MVKTNMLFWCFLNNEIFFYLISQFQLVNSGYNNKINIMQPQFLQQSKKNTQKIITAVMVCCMAAFITGCSPSIKIVGSWINKDRPAGKSYKSVFIAVLAQNMAARSILENDIAAAAEANGIKAVRSLAVFTPVTGVADSIVIAAFVKKVYESGCSSILIVSLLDAQTETKYIPGSSYNYQPYPYYGYYGNFYNYYSYSFNIISTPGYYKTDKTYYIESNLYDVDTQGILFSIQTKAANPPAIDKSAQKFTETLVEELKSNGLLKKGS